MESFAGFMDRCLFHGETGYYGSGKVRFGQDDHFWTYPMNFSPVFGWLMAERIRSILDCWAGEGLLPGEGPITILELGSGNGFLARDLLDYLAGQPHDSPWNPYLNRIRYVAGELSAPLRKLQKDLLAPHIRTGRAQVKEMDARALTWDDPFVGVILANELLDALPCERLRITGPGPEAHRCLLSPEDGREGDARREVWTPVGQGWLPEGGGGDAPPPSDLLAYLRSISPLVDDLHYCELLPVELFWPSSLPALMDGLSGVLSSPGNLGTAILVDYGGTTRHVMDPRSSGPHLRSYGGGDAGQTVETLFRNPGRVDITCDVDFTEVGRLAEDAGLEVKVFGHQSELEGPAVKLDSKVVLDAIAGALALNVGLAPDVAKMAAPYAVRRFRRAPCFWMMALAPSATPHPRSTPMHRPGSEVSLSTLGLRTSESDLRVALGKSGLPTKIAEILKPCGDLAADLSDGGYLGYLDQIQEILEEKGWLVPPGGMAEAPRG